MSDMADFALSETMDAEDDRFSYRMGEMSDQNAYDLGIIDELGGYKHPSMFSGTSARQMRCKYCGAGKLSWLETDRGWRLATLAGDLHSCKEHTFEKSKS